MEVFLNGLYRKCTLQAEIPAFNLPRKIGKRKDFSGKITRISGFRVSTV